MRVVAVLNSINPATIDGAGGVVHFIEVARRWKNVQLTIVAPASARAALLSALPAASYVATPDFGTQNSAVGLIRRGIAAMWLVRRLRRENDVLLALSHWIPDTLPALAFGRKRSAVTLWHFAENPLRRPGNFITNVLAYVNDAIGRSIASACGGYIIGSRLLAKELRVAGRTRFAITTNGVEHALSERPHEAERSGAIFVGRIHPSKGLEDLVYAWVKIRELGRPLHLTIVGRSEPEYEAWIRGLIEAQCLTDLVTLRLDVSNQERTRLLAASKLFVFPSKEEGWAIAVAEAMASGLPCVTYALPIFEEVFPEGRICAETGNVQQFAAAVLLLDKDEETYSLLASQARDLARTFTWEHAADVERDLLASLAVPNVPK